MLPDEIKIQYIGGATALFEVAGLRFITDPTFDKKGAAFTTPLYTLRRMTEPSADSGSIGPIDFVLLSHDHHFDNLDNEGRHFLSSAVQVFTTVAGAERLGGNATGLANWQTIEVPTKDNRILTITGTPCRHGPVNGDRGPVTGFILGIKNEDPGSVYISGDTVWYEGVEEVAKRYPVKIAVLFMGAAVVKNVGPAHLTMTVEEAIEATRHFSQAQIIPLHFEGWEHFTESKPVIESGFAKAGLSDRLYWPAYFG